MCPDTTLTAPNSPHRAGVGEDDAVEQRPFDVGQGNAPNICQPLAPSISAACSSLSPCACIKGMISRATREGNEQRRQNNAGDGEDNLYALRFQPTAQCRVRAEQ